MVVAEEIQTTVVVTRVAEEILADQTGATKAALVAADHQIFPADMVSRPLANFQTTKIIPHRAIRTGILMIREATHRAHRGIRDTAEIQAEEEMVAGTHQIWVLAETNGDLEDKVPHREISGYQKMEVILIDLEVI